MLVLEILEIVQEQLHKNVDGRRSGETYGGAPVMLFVLLSFPFHYLSFTLDVVSTSYVS